MISLHEITPELMHQYYRQFESDPDLFMDMSQYTPYQYDPEKVDARYHAKKASTDRRDFFIMRCGKPVGEVILKHINLENGECELSIHRYTSRTAVARLCFPGAEDARSVCRCCPQKYAQPARAGEGGL